MSRFRPELGDAPKGSGGLTYTASYFRVLQAVTRRRGLIHGRLRDSHGGTCALGAYFDEAAVPLSARAVDEIAAYNDSFPHLSPGQRWRKVLAWLRFETTRMRGSRQHAAPSAVGRADSVGEADDPQGASGPEGVGEEPR